MHNTDTFTGPSFPFRNRLYRAVWNGAYLLLFRFSPSPLHFWRRGILRLFGAKVGRGVKIYPAAKIWAPWNIELGDECGIANEANLYSQDRIHIGFRATVSQGAYLCCGTHNYLLKGNPLVTKPIKIGDYVWIAAQAFIHPGVSIGTGAVIGARSVVVRDIPGWTVSSGNPCTVIKDRQIIDLNK